MHWREKLVARILLMLAKMVVDNTKAELYKDLCNLHSHITAGIPEEK